MVCIVPFCNGKGNALKFGKNGVMILVPVVLKIDAKAQVDVVMESNAVGKREQKYGFRNNTSSKV